MKMVVTSCIQTLFGAVPTDKKFTGQRLDATGLYYYNARYYDVLIGRFISADSIIPSLNPQYFNRYSYCLNNPLKYIDPSGHENKNEGMDPTPKRVLIDGVDITDFTLKQLWEFYLHSSEEVRALIRGWMAFRNEYPELAQALLDSETRVNINWGTLDDSLPSSTSVDDEGNIQITLNTHCKHADEWFIFGNLACEAIIAHDKIYGPGAFWEAIFRVGQFLLGLGECAVGTWSILTNWIIGAYPGATLINVGWNNMMGALGQDQAKIPFQLGPNNMLWLIRPIR
jgi:RHS repeat-associated protein